MNRKKRNGKSFLSLLLAVLMTLSLLPVSGQTAKVHAEETPAETVQEDVETGSEQQEDILAEVSADNTETLSEEETVLSSDNTVTYVPNPDALPDSDELFAEYVAEQFYGDEASPAANNGQTVLEGKSPRMSLFYSGVETFANFGGSYLSGRNLQIYNSLKTSIASVAANGGSTTFVVPLDSPITWTGDLSQADAQFSASVDFNGIIDCLLVDNPYELYWYDKTTGTRASYVANSTGQQVSITEIRFTFFVAAAYQGGSDSTVSVAQATAAGNAARTAQSIATQYAALSPYEQMNAFKTEICNLTDYNYSAGSATDYGDPWQIIYVFDDNPSTTVVCEGYAKAFQYLCDLNGLTCYTVTGIMGGGTGAGAHMWNIVTLDGNNYLVDVTNSDAGTVGQDGGLFLAGTSGDVNAGYTFQAGGSSVSYQYDAEQITLYGNNILTLASSDYTPSQVVPTVTASASVQNVTYGYTSAPQLSVALQNADGTSASYQWYQVDAQGSATPVANATAASYTLPTGLNAGTYTYYCAVNAGGQPAVSNRVTVTVARAGVTPAISGTTVKEYDGTTGGPSGIGIDLSGVISGDTVSASAQSYAYNSADVSAANQITASGITLTGADAGNYQLDATTASASGSITRRSVTVTPNAGQSKMEGQADPALTYTVTSGTVVSGETLQGQLSREAGETIGTYAITQGTLTNDLNPNYNIVFGGNVTFEITEYITHTITFVADGVTVGTVTAGHGESVDAARFPQIPAKAGYDTIPPAWNPGSIKSLTSDMTVNAVYFSSQAQEVALPATASGLSLKLIVESGITTVPESLANNASLNTAEKIQTALQTAIAQTGVSADATNTSLYNVTLMVYEGSGWIIAGPEHFGTGGGLTITMPYPTGTGMNSHDFTVAHMFTSADFGKQPGGIETPAVTKTDAGIQFTVTGLSPVMISWRAAQTTGNAQTSASGNAQTTATASASGTPSTGDSMDAAMLYAALLASCVAISAVVVYRKKKLR